MKKWLFLTGTVIGLALILAVTLSPSNLEYSNPIQILKKTLYTDSQQDGAKKVLNLSPPSLPITGVEPQFQKWFTAQSAAIESSTPNPDEKEAELREKATTLTTEEIDFLSREALDPESPANQKIFATYLLSLAPENTAAGLITIVSSPLQYKGPNPTHSPEETLAMQEKTLRKMALESLLQQASKDPQFREGFNKSTGQISDSTLRDYAEQVLANMK